MNSHNTVRRPAFHDRSESPAICCEALENRCLLSTTIQVNFQPPKTPASDGYVRDIGRLYGKQGEFRFGWNANNSANAILRDSADAPDDRYNTGNILIRRSDARYWEIAVPNGLYRVHIVGGDPDLPGQAIQINAESTLVVDGVTSAKRLWAEGTGSVRVRDGRLTISAARGSAGTPINFIEITPLRDSMESMAASSFDSMHGVFSSGQAVSSLDNGDWLRFDNVLLDGVRSVHVDLASTTRPQPAAKQNRPMQMPVIEFRLNKPNGRVIGRLRVQPTGGAETFYTESASIDRASGVNSLYLVFKGLSPAGTVRSIQFDPRPLTRIMPLGDSITQGEGEDATYRYWLWQDLMKGKVNADFVGSEFGVRPGSGDPPYWNFDQDHEAHRGSTTADVLANIDTYAASKPDVVLIHLGTNDLLRNRPVEEIIGNLSKIIGHFRSQNPSVKIVVSKIIPSTRIWPPTLQRLNNGIAQLAIEKKTSQSPVVAVDQFTDFDAATDTYDGVHPYEWGEQKMAARFYAALKPLLQAK